MKNFSNYHADSTDAFEYQLKGILFIVVIYACFIAHALNWLNLFWMVTIVSIITSRWMITLHELFHLKKADEVDVFTRLIPIPFSFFSLGYREHRAIHFGHHQHAATDKDPDAFHILGGPFKAFLGAATLQEQAAYHHLSTVGINKELLVMMVIRTSIFVLCLVLFPTAFLAWWLTLRLTYIINDYVFFHVVHFRSGKCGTYAIPLPNFLKLPAVFIYGVDVVYATMHHDLHHKHPRIAPKYLPMIAKQLKGSV